MSENSYQNQSSNSGVHKVIVPWKLLVLIVILSVSAAVLVSSLFIIKGWPRSGIDIGEKEKFNISGTIINKNEAVTKLSAKILKRRLDTILIAGSSYSKNQRLIRFINEDKWFEAVNSVAGLLREDLKGPERIILTDIAGTLKADYPRVPEINGQNFAFRDWYKGVIEDFEPYLSEVYKRTAKPQFNVVGFAFPVKDEKGIPIAILVIQTKSDAFLDWIYDINIAKEGRLFIVDQKGQVVAHPDFAPQGDIIDYSGEPDVQRVVGGLAGSDIFFDKKSFISSYEPLVGYGWGVIVRVPVKEVK